MENGNQFLKKPNLDKKLFLAVVITTAVFLLGTASIIEAKKVNDKEADEIKTFLKLSNVPFFSKYSEEDIKKLLNLKISAVEISDFTYGLLVLSVKDDIDFMDMILTQAYKQEARDYFNGLLDKKLDLVSHLGNVGKNLYSLAQKGGEVGPYTGLALESVSITNKTIEIFSTFNILKEMKKYDGLWYYFDLRKQGNESHKTAWEEAKIVMGWAAETGSRFKGAGHNNTTQLESQFIALWDKWEPYITPYGISEDYKKQVRNELNDTLITEAERTPVFVKKESGPSFIERYVQQLNRMKELVAGLISQVNPFSAGPIINLPEESPETEIKNEPEKLIEDEPYPTVNLTAKPNLDDMQEDLDDILENLDIVSQETENLLEINSQPDEMTEAESPLIEPGPPSDADLAKEEQKESPETDLAINKGDEVELKDIIKPFCQKIAGDLPLRFRVFINEVGWAGTDNSASDEWIELRNIWGIPVNLNGWQLLDKDGQIKIVFQESDIIQPNDYYLLERTDDDSIPGVPADLIYSGALNNSNEALYLFDNNCELEDEAEASPDWPGGDNAQKKAMERLDNLYWYTYHGSAQGTPGTENSSPPREYSNTSPVLEAEEEQSFAPQILIPEVQTETGVAAVVINEIAWAGTGASAFDEWIELYNNSTSSIDIAGWRLSSSDVDGPDIVFSTSSAATTTIEAYGFYLIERTNNETISDISAGLMGSFGNGLSNTNCEVLSLYNSNGDLIDKTACSVSDWPGGEASPNYVSMERISVASGTDVGNWASNNLITRNGLDAGGNAINGTPKSENSVSMSFTEISGTLSLEEDLVLTLLGSPYIIEGSITVNEGIKLTIEAGVIIKFKHNSNWHSALNVMGELEAIGGENLDQKIIFTSIYDDEYGGDTNNDGVTSQPAVGDWEWLYLNDAQSVLENVVIRYAGKKLGGPPMAPYYTKGAVYIDGGQTLIENSIIEKSQTLGIWLNNSSSTSITTTEFNEINTSWSKPAAIYIESSSPTISSSTFNGNNIGILVEGVAGPVIENNTFEANYIPIQINNLLAFISNNILQNNNYNGIYLTGLNYPDGQTSITWRKTNNPYVVETLSLPAGLDFNIEPGVIIKFLYQKRLNIEANFRAEGTESEKIIFTSIYDDEYGGDTNNDGTITQPGAGRWHYIYFSSSTTSPVLDNVIVRYGGWQNTFLGGVNAKSGAIKTDGAPLTIKNSVIENNLYAGVELISSVSQIENTIFRDHRATYGFSGSNSAALYMDNSTTTFSNAVFNNNYYGIYVLGTCPNLSGVSFGEGDDANSKKTFPMSCPL